MPDPRATPADKPDPASPRAAGDAPTASLQHPEPKTADLAPPAPIPERIGRYHIKRLLGSGGMGSVYEAVQEQPRRIVALKVMKQGIASRSALRRFEYEAQLLARLRHPGIAQVYEAGTHHDPGRLGATVPFFAMEYIPGARPITEHADRRNLSARDRLDLFCKVCDAVHFGHTKGVIHRDLKPANILVDAALGASGESGGAAGAQSRTGQPKIIDFGVARATDSDLAVTTLQTDIGQLIGTLQYMSPEQCAADPHDIDTRSDVYALGVVLYELLCGRLPYDVSKSRIFEATRVIREQAPVRPSTVNRTLRGDIETIALKALEKDRERRYRSAAEFADDIRRYLRSEPISARPPSLTYQFRMLARRNRPLVAAAAAVILALAVALVGISLFAYRADVQRRRATDQEYITRLAAAQLYILLNDIRTATTHLEDAPAGSRDWEWRHLRSRLDLSIDTLPDPGGGVLACAVSRDGDIIASGGISGDIRFIDAKTRSPLASWHAHKGPLNALAFSPDRATLASGGDDGLVRLWNLRDHSQRAVLTGHTGPVHCLAFTPDGTLLLSGSDDTTIRRWDPTSGADLGVIAGHSSSVQSIAVTSDGTTLASAATDISARLWDIRTGEQLARFIDAGALFAAAVADVPIGNGRHRTLAAFGGNNSIIRIVDVADRKVVGMIMAHEFRINRLAFSPDGTLLASASWDRTVRLWDTTDWRAGVTLRGHVEPIMDCAFSPDGRTIVTASSDQTVRLWDARGYGDVPTIDAYWEAVDCLGFSPDGSRFASGSSEAQPVRIWDGLTGDLQGAMAAQRDVRALAYVAPDTLATAGRDGTIQIWDTTRLAKLADFPAHAGPIDALAVLPPSQRGAADRLVSAGKDGACRTWRLPGGEADGTLDLEGPVAAIALCTDRRTLVLARRDGRITLADARTLTAIRSFNAAGTRVRSIAVDPWGRHIAVASEGAGVRVYPIDGGDSVDMCNPASQVLTVAYAAGGRRLFMGTLDGALIVRDPDRHADLLPLLGHRHAVLSLAASPDGSTVVSGSDDSSIRMWHTVPARQRLTAGRSAREARDRARPLVDSLFAQHVTTASVLAHLIADTSLDPAQREAAMTLARGRADALFAANWDSWQTVKKPAQAVADYERAMRRVQVVLQFMPDDGNYVNTLGVALYRLGRDEEAVTALRRANQLNSASPPDRYPGGPFPADHAFLALSLQRLGRTDEAAPALARFRELASGPKWSADAETIAFAAEVNAVFGAPPPP